MSQIIDGKALAETLRTQLKEKVAAFKSKTGVTPGLATVIVGEDPASQVYVRNKNKACDQAGMFSKHCPLSANISEEDLLTLVSQLNEDPSIHGILVQLPLPKHINEEKILLSIDPAKDVDGFHPMNMGNLLVGKEGVKPCTPYGMMKMLENIGCDLTGKDAVVVGRSNIVGKPIALLLLEKNATVTICHSRTQNLAEKVKQADIVVAAVGRANFVKGDWIKKGAIVLDVGINRLDNGKLTGDVDFEGAQAHAGWITPVPGGVGPMTIAMLLVNTLEACERIVRS